jgi:hypothetical protein
MGNPDLKDIVWKTARIALLLGVAVGIGVAILCVLRIERRVHAAMDPYAVDWAARMVIMYMEEHDGQWPEEWEDLRDQYGTLVHALSSVHSFEELQFRVAIDFTFDPRKYVSRKVGKGSSIRLVWLKDGHEYHWSGLEPNEMIIKALDSRLEETAPPATAR